MYLTNEAAGPTFGPATSSPGMQMSTPMMSLPLDCLHEETQDVHDVQIESAGLSGRAP